MIFNLIMFVCFAPIVWIMYFVLRNEVKPKKNIILGVTLPLAAREDSAVTEICAEYKKQLFIWSIILGALPAVIFFVSYNSVAMTILTFWLLIALGAIFGIYTYFHLALKKVKALRGWDVSNSSIKLVDTTAVQFARKQVSAWWFLLPVAVAVIPIIAALIDVINGVPDSAWQFILYVTDFLLAALFYWIYSASSRQRAEIIDENTDLTIALTRVRRYNIDKFLVVGAVSTALFSVGVWLFMDMFWGIMITSCLYAFALIYVALQTEFALRKAQQSLTQKSGGGVYVDEDKQWILGMFYHNVDDKRFMVNNRIGLGMTMNMARPVAKIIMIISLLLIIALPAAGFFMMHEEFTPPRIELTQTQIVAYHTRITYAVDYTAIESTDLLTELPRVSKINGTNFDNLYKGVFTVDGIGRSYLNLNPQSHAFIVIKTSGGTYIFSCADKDETIQIYEELLARIQTAHIAPFFLIA